MKHVLYIGQAFDPLEQIFVENRKKVGITMSSDKLPIREGQLKRDAGTIMPFGYVVVKAWEFLEPVAGIVESLVHNIRTPYAGEWILDDDDTLVDGVSDIISNLKYESKVIQLDDKYKEDKQFNEVKKNNSWYNLERKLYEKVGDVEFNSTTHLREAAGELLKDGYYVDGVRYKTLGQACRKIVGGSTRCYEAFKIDGVSIIDKMRENGIDVV